MNVVEYQIFCRIRIKKFNFLNILIRNKNILPKNAKAFLPERRKAVVFSH